MCRVRGGFRTNCWPTAGNVLSFFVRKCAYTDDASGIWAVMSNGVRSTAWSLDVPINGERAASNNVHVVWRGSSSLMDTSICPLMYDVTVMTCVYRITAFLTLTFVEKLYSSMCGNNPLKITLLDEFFKDIFKVTYNNWWIQS